VSEPVIIGLPVVGALRAVLRAPEMQDDAPLYVLDENAEARPVLGAQLGVPSGCVYLYVGPPAPVQVDTAAWLHQHNANVEYVARDDTHEGPAVTVTVRAGPAARRCSVKASDLDAAVRVLAREVREQERGQRVLLELRQLLRAGDVPAALNFLTLALGEAEAPPGEAAT